MRILKHSFAIIVICVAILPVAMQAVVQANGIITSRLAETIKQAQSGSPLKVWVYFSDKDTSNLSLAKLKGQFTDRALERRRDIPLDFYDIPVSHAYIQAIERAGGHCLRVSRWLNAASVLLTPKQVTDISTLKFVSRIDNVLTLTRKPALEATKSPLLPVPSEGDYGLSYTQNHMILADSAHALGYDGSGVLIAFLDSGFKIDHESFNSMTIVKTYDFINDDESVDDIYPAASQTNHGTATLSACGGYAPGNLIGTAYGASYILAKTEIIPQEIQVEEDNWVAAAEWADSLGADIISSSLGYNDWYTTNDMDGNTAVTTIAADIAASRGILVVVSAGNEGLTSWRTITAPADGDSVVAVGAVDASGYAASFSSYGPTADGRVKPEVSAMGVSVQCANDAGGYYAKSGTSLAAPLIAGAAALVLQANPHLKGKPMLIRERLIEAGNLYPIPDPNNHLGYGLPNTVEALKSLRIEPIPPVYIHVDDDTAIVLTAQATDGRQVSFHSIDLPTEYALVDNGDGTATLTIIGNTAYIGSYVYHISVSDSTRADTLAVEVVTIANKNGTPFFVGPNPFTESVTIQASTAFPNGFEIEIFALSGEQVFETRESSTRFTWAGTNQSGEKVASGVYIIRITADGIEKKVKVFKL